MCAFDSLDDAVTIDDLAGALETRMRDVERRRGWDTTKSVFICHSTGALIVRRWLLNRAASGDQIPSHLITMAGANHGSTLAQIGKTPLGYAHQFFHKNTLGVGAGILTDLDYGSSFLLRLNREWLAMRNGDPGRGVDASDALASLYVFSMGGDYNGSKEEPAVDLLWASAESGSDNTVRISGANLNYTYLLGDVAAKSLRALPSKPQAHLVIPGKSHYGRQTGILASNTAPTNVPMLAIREALDIDAPDKYLALVTKWTDSSHTWSRNNHDDTNSTIVFYLRDQNGVSINDCYIGFLDSSVPGLDATRPEAKKGPLVAALASVSGAMNNRQPIHNDTQLGSYSFYVKTERFNAIQRHVITISTTTSSDLVTCGPLSFTVDHDTVERMIFPNQFTYVEIVLPRVAEKAFAVYDATPWPPDAALWLPFPQRGRFAPP